LVRYARFARVDIFRLMKSLRAWTSTYLALLPRFSLMCLERLGRDHLQSVYMVCPDHG
jgi:hypothetical protein